MALHRNLIENSRIVRGRGTIKVQERMIVDDLSPGDNLLVQALTYPGVPQPNDQHPWFPTALVLDQEPKALSTTSVEMLVRWETVQSPFGAGGVARNWVVQTSIASQQIQTNLDVDGKPLVWRWDASGVATASTAIKRVGTISILRPMALLRATKWFLRNEYSALAPRWLAAVGTVNFDRWYGLDRGHWLFTGVDDITRDDGASHTATISFLGNPYGWTAEVVGKDQFGNTVRINDAEGARMRDGRYISDSGNGWLKALPYKTEDFSSLFSL